MRILKVLNNNAALVKGYKDQEWVIMAKGISFGRHSGDVLSDDLDCKRFILYDKEITDKFSQLIQEIPEQIVYTTEKIINYGKIKLQVPLSERLYLTLTDHIAAVIDRYEKGIKLNNPLLYEIKRFYPNEYDVGKKAIQIIKRDLGVDMLEDEISFIALHFVNAQLHTVKEATNDAAQIVQKAIEAAESYFNNTFDEESVDYFRFVNNLNFLSQRILQGENEPDKSGDLYETIREAHLEAYGCVEAISHIIRQDYSYKLSSEEKLHLVLHIERMVRHL